MHNRSRILLLAILSLLVSLSAYAGEKIDMALVKNKVTIDLRKDQTSTNLFMVILFARKPVPEKESKVGHAYTATLQFDEGTNAFLVTGVFGLYPKEKVWHLGKFPGQIDITELDANPNIALLAWINKPEYDKVLAVRSKWEKKGTWQALQGDCVSMMSDAAKAADLQIPERLQGVLPFEFLTNLIKANHR